MNVLHHNIDILSYPIHLFEIVSNRGFDDIVKSPDLILSKIKRNLQIRDRLQRNTVGR